MMEIKSQPNKLPFKPTSPGNALIGSKIEYIEDGLYSQPKKFGGHETKPNILTTGPKKGSFGVPGTTIGKFELMSEPYYRDSERIAVSAARKAACKACISAEPFKPSNPSKKGILPVT
jgi:hypothetical protein